MQQWKYNAVIGTDPPVAREGTTFGSIATALTRVALVLTEAEHDNNQAPVCVILTPPSWGT